MIFTNKPTILLGFATVYSLAAGFLPGLAKAEENGRLAQAVNCRQVDVNTALNVRETPGGATVGMLKDGENVYLSAEPADGWVAIGSPMDGYVSTDYLNYCTGAISSPAQPVAQATPTIPGDAVPSTSSTVPGSNCRQIITPDVTIRQEPGGEAIGTLEQNQEVYIANEGNRGWVPIESPVSGYVSATNLGYCDGATPGDEQSRQPLPPSASNPGEFVSTVPEGDCRETNTSGVTIFDEPGGEIVGTLEADQAVYIANEGRNGWVPVEVPVNGYVNADYLTYCSGPLPNIPTSSCREVDVYSRLNVREEPGGETIAQLEDGRAVSIRDRGQNGWVPIVAPLQGYVSAEYLEYCP
ncbi:MAG: SH3 domain-containing protein [Limnospira sp.]